MTKYIYPLLLLTLLLSSCTTPPPAATTIFGQTMGTTYSIKINGTVNNPQQLKANIDRELAQINSLMSTYDLQSEISRFNSLQSTEWFDFSDDTIKVLLASLDIALKSGGAFDITVAPLVNLWGFGPDGSIENPPTAEAIQKVKKNIGFQKLIIDALARKARKKQPNLTIDLSAIAKGFGVDKIAELLSKNKFKNYMVEIGGEIKTSGTRIDGKPWQIALEKPVASKKSINRIISVSNQAIATSGSYRNYFEKDGIRYSHTINPQTSKPITHNLISVSVAHESCMMADAWATSLMVLGLEKGMNLAEQYKIKAVFIIKDPEKENFKQEESSLWNL